MSEGVPVRYRWSLAELTEAARWHLRQKRMRKFFVFLWAVAVLAGVLAAVLSWRSGKTLQLFYATAATTYFLLMPRLQPGIVLWQMRRNFARSAGRDAEIEWRITSTHLRTQHTHGSSEMVWSAFIKAILTPKGLLLYQQPLLFHWLPRHGFEDDAGFEAVTAWARQQLPSFSESR